MQIDHIRSVKLSFKFVIVLFVLCHQASAQWSTNGTGSSSVVYNNTGGVVEVKQPNTTIPAFHVYNSVVGGSPGGTKVELQRFSAPGNSSSPIFNVAGIFAKTNALNSSQSYLSINPINTNGSGFAEGLTIY